MSKSFQKRKKGTNRKPLSSSTFLNSWEDTPPEKLPLSEGFEPSQKSLIAIQKQGEGMLDPNPYIHDPRQLSSLLTYGPSPLPWTSAWTDQYTEQVRHFKYWTYVCINKIARKIASQYPNVTWTKDCESEKKDTEKYIPPFMRTRALIPLLTHEQLEPVPRNHPLHRLLRDPNQPDTSFDLWYETLMYLLLTGSAFWWVPKDPILKLPSAIWVVPRHWVWPVMGKDGNPLAAWEIRPFEGNYLRRILPADEVIHFKFKNPISKIDGFSPQTAMAQWEDVSESVNRSTWHAYKNGITPTVAIQFDGKLNDPSDEDLKRIEAKFIAKYSSENRSNKPFFLPPGVSVRPLVIKPNEMVFGRTGVHMRDNICAGYGVPLELIDLKGDTRKAEESFCSQTINPLCQQLGITITEKLANQYPADDGELKVWWERFSANDPELENENTRVDLLCMAITPNERRIARGKEPLQGEEYNKPIRPVNMAPGTLPGGGEHEPDTNNDNDPEMPAINDDDT